MILNNDTINKLLHDYEMMDLSQTDVILVQNIKDNRMIIWTTEEQLEDPALANSWQILGHLTDYKTANELIKFLQKIRF